MYGRALAHRLLRLLCCAILVLPSTFPCLVVFQHRLKAEIAPATQRATRPHCCASSSSARPPLFCCLLQQAQGRIDNTTNPALYARILLHVHNILSDNLFCNPVLVSLQQAEG